MLKKSIVEFLKGWGWSGEDFKDGLKETRYSIYVEFINDNKDELVKDSTEFSNFIESIKENGTVSVSSISNKPKK